MQTNQDLVELLAAGQLLPNAFSSTSSSATALLSTDEATVAGRTNVFLRHQLLHQQRCALDAARRQGVLGLQAGNLALSRRAPSYDGTTREFLELSSMQRIAAGSSAYGVEAFNFLSGGRALSGVAPSPNPTTMLSSSPSRSQSARKHSARDDLALLLGSTQTTVDMRGRPGTTGQGHAGPPTATNEPDGSINGNVSKFASIAKDEEEDEDEDSYFGSYFSSQPQSQKERFPVKLYRMIYEVKKDGNEAIVSFLPHGKAFAIHDEVAFMRNVMPQYFPGCQLSSLQKQLNLYGFHKITVGKDKGKLHYFHAQFLKGKPSLSERIQRRRPRKH